jgi:uncharacterized protein YeaO (DUF488 family)
MPVKIKRVYEPAERGDGIRILVDRLWPRGVAKDKIDLWIKDVAPSNTLRNWFHHDERKWSDFAAKYRKELSQNDAAVAELRGALKGKPATLLYGARDETHNQAVVLLDFLKRPAKKKSKKKPTKKKTAKKKAKHSAD